MNVQVSDPVGSPSSMTRETPRRVAMAAATDAVLKILAQAKNPRTTLGRYAPRSVAFHAAYAAVKAFEESMQETAR